MQILKIPANSKIFKILQIPANPKNSYKSTILIPISCELTVELY